ncbi:sigma-70 family RNA polymerase sigma factor [Clostridium nigeriense]|uniref:sigma-70 family RNA polymerase sigma factor n=1 Tax=Clostridium nigeriense TaxID=1805470 RepID=UPI00082E0BC3|nr:sigma-70 family RNA polymerase sigma factor [Clostridium nigeriense]
MDNEELIQLYQNGYNRALDKLIENNIGIIKKIAIKYNGINRELELDDLIQEGVLGIIAAANKYDFNNEKKAKFITFAVFYIDRYIHSCVNGRSTKQIGNNKLYSSCTSLNITTGEEGETRELGDFIEKIDYGFENVEEKIYIQNLRKELEEVMNQYNTLEQRQILKFRYGWNSKRMNLNEISEIVCISSNRVRDIEKQALRKLRNSSWAMNNLKEFAELGYIDKFHLQIFRDWGIEV